MPAFVCGGLLLYGCGMGSYQTSEIKPGEADYPQENPNPVQTLAITANIPSDPKVRFIARYRVSPSAGGTMQSGQSCQREVGLAVTAPYVLHLQVPMARNGDSYAGAVTVDRYLPGRCKWQFVDLTLDVDGSGLEPFPFAHTGNQPGESTDNQLDIWCTRKLKLFPNQTVACGDLRALTVRFLEQIPLTLIDSIKTRGEARDGPVIIGPNTRSLTIRFHDLDAMLTSQQ
jgi:hypothetical protein